MDFSFLLLFTRYMLSLSRLLSLLVFPLASKAFTGERCLQWSRRISIFFQTNSLGMLPGVQMLSVWKQMCLAWNPMVHGPLQLSHCIYANCSSWDQQQRVWLCLAAMRCILQQEEPSGTATISAAWSEFYRGPRIHAVFLLYQELQAVYQGQHGLLSAAFP